MRAYKRLLIFIPFLILLFPPLVFGQLVINEVLPNPNNEDKGAEIVELYNTTNSPVSLKNCILYLHETNNSQKVVFGDEDFVNDYKAISWDYEWLNNSGDTIRLVCETFNDTIAYGDATNSQINTPKEGVSFGRSPDGSDNIVMLSAFTPGEPNALPPSPTPEPTDKPTNTPVPTKVPTSTPTPKPKPTATKVPTKAIPTRSNIPSTDQTNSEEQRSELVLGIEDNKSNTLDEATNSGKSGFPALATIPIVGGVLFIAGAGISFVRQRKKIV